MNHICNYCKRAPAITGYSCDDYPGVLMLCFPCLKHLVEANKNGVFKEMLNTITGNTPEGENMWKWLEMMNTVGEVEEDTGEIPMPALRPSLINVKVPKIIGLN